MNEDRIRTPWGERTTAEELVAGIDLSGKRIVVTGGSSGLGAETARCLAMGGAEITLGVRRLDAGEEVAAAIRQGINQVTVNVRRLDLDDLGSVADFVADWDGPLDVLVNNAGVMRLPARELSPQGWELQLATNHLGHFALALGLQPALAAAGNARVVVVSSRAHMRTRFDFQDPQFERREYDPQTAYGQSKTANVLFAVGATERWKPDGITVNALHPGTIADTGISRHMNHDLQQQLRTSDIYTFKSIPEGAATSVFLASSPLVHNVSGRYFEDVNEAPVVAGEPADLHDVGKGVAAYALDPGSADRLWDLSQAALPSDFRTSTVRR